VVAPRSWFKGAGAAHDLKDFYPAGWQVL
jgi:hypothetical protein